MPQNSFSQDCPSRALHNCLTAGPTVLIHMMYFNSAYKFALQECLWCYTSALQECSTRQPCASVFQDCLAGVLRKSVLRECLALIPTANLLGFNLWGWGVVTRKYTPLTTGTVPEQSWNSRGLLEPSWNCTECPSGIPFRKSCRNLSGSHNKTCGFCLSLVLLFCIFFA